MYELYEDQLLSVDRAMNMIQSGQPNETGLILAPTGSGKSVMIAETSRQAFNDSGARVLVLSFSENIIQQDFTAYDFHTGYNNTAGVYCAGLKRKELDSPVTFATIQSFVNIKDLSKFEGCFLIIDESHCLGADNESNINKIIERIKPSNIVGYTATGYRSDIGLLEYQIFDSVLLEITYESLIKIGRIIPIMLPVNAHAEVMTLGNQVKSMIIESVDFSHNMIYTTSIDQAITVHKRLIESGETACLAHSKMSKAAIKESVHSFESGQSRHMVNVDMFTTGYDFRPLQCLTVLRDMSSLGLWCQMLGRGMRSYGSQTHCMLLDYGNNVEKYGLPPEFDLSAVEGCRIKEKASEFEEVIIEVADRDNQGDQCDTCRTTNKPGATYCIGCDSILNTLTGSATSQEQSWFPVIHCEIKNIFQKAKGRNLILIELGKHSIMLFPDSPKDNYANIKSRRTLSKILGQKISYEDLKRMPNNYNMLYQAESFITRNIRHYRVEKSGNYTNVVAIKDMKGKEFKI